MKTSHLPYNLSSMLDYIFRTSRSLDDFLERALYLYSQHKSWDTFAPSVNGFSWRRLEILDFLEAKGMSRKFLRWWLRWYKIKNCWKRLFGYNFHDEQFVRTLEEML